MKHAVPLLLNVDDDAASLYVKSRVLRGAGYDVVEARTAAEARRLLLERSPELVLLDVRLPDGNGRELCAWIKASEKTAQTLVLQTSASHIEASHRVASLEAGADAYLVEPMEPEELVATVRALLRVRKAERELHVALEALQEADRRKDEFLAMLAHELRNPLAPISNAVDILRSDDPAIRERARGIIARQVEHLARLVGDLLDVSRITQRKVTLQPAVVTLASILEAAIEANRPLLERQRHELATAWPHEPLWLRVDAVRLTQVVGNLLNNAAKFTRPGGRIALEADIEGDTLAIRVSDNGMGISAEVLPRVFELFTQGERSLDRSQGGLGIGLSVVRGLVEMHGGTVRAQSGGSGQGSRFEIRLPLPDLRADPPEARGARAPDGAPRRILVVEDNVDAAEAMQLVLRGRGHEVATVSDGREALALARTFRPDVILLDIGLPGIDGYQLAVLLREAPETARARIIAVSGYGQERDVQRSREAGFDLHLVKPVDAGRLSDAIGAVAG